MLDPWKTIICDSDQCISEMFEPEEPGSTVARLNQDTVAKYKILPDIDTPEFTQFTCPRCGKTETWGVTRRQVAKTLYERFGSIDLTKGA
jgi:predicted RNA-binding Zn-ribbon protein involved in translation (DUF1610 family)